MPSDLIYAISPDTPGTLKNYIGNFAQYANGQSGFLIFDTGDESLKARLSLIHSAEKTLDLQYYAISNDVTSNLLIEAIIRAAERGVRVRLLIDDISVGKIYKSLSALDSFKNVYVRIFNPITTLEQSWPTRLIAFFANLRRTTRRMHNKALIADNQISITGGRNLGDEYFDAKAELSFKDIDVLAAGPITTKISEVFDEFWNARQSYPVTDLYGKNLALQALRKFRAKLFRKNKHKLKNESGYGESLTEYLQRHEKDVIWADADYISDKPEKTQENAANDGPVAVIRSLVEDASEEFVIVSPYFVPRAAGIDWLHSLQNKGMALKILTNSLASTDVVAVHTGYRRYRRAILESGISLYELKPIDGKRTKQRVFAKKSPSYASLHAKVYVIDSKISVIGSLNFDPRSIQLNTEGALIVYSDALSQKLQALIADVMEPDTSYKVSLEDGNIVWDSMEKDGPAHYKWEPRASVWRIMQTLIISCLPVENQL